MEIKRALISVSDKTGVFEFAKELNQLGVEIISSGGTAKALKKKKVPCVEITSVTGFPEILDGRVKTLNPMIHGGILAEKNKKKHIQELEKHGIGAIDIVAVNLYPFEKAIASLKEKGKKITKEVIENIDIGGVALLRAAAKNFNHVIVLCDIADYGPVLEKIKTRSLTTEFKKELAAKAFRHTAQYDGVISSYFTEEILAPNIILPLKKIAALRYGENPHQSAALYEDPVTADKYSIVRAKKFQGKELSYNNILDMESAWRLVQEFENPACAIIKHNNPCGCAEGKNPRDAYRRAYVCDPVSAFGGVIAFNSRVDEKTAKEIIGIFTECVIAPSYSVLAKKVFREKKNIRLLELPLRTPHKPFPEREFRKVSGGMLVQEADKMLMDEMKMVTKRSLAKNELVSLKFAWKVSKHVKSNAIVLARGKQTVGIGAGQMSRIDSLMIATEKMKNVLHNLDEKKNPLVLSSDAFFPFSDVVNESAKIAVTAIIQPGGSIRDEDSIKAADEKNIAMAFTGMRHFRH